MQIIRRTTLVPAVTAFAVLLAASSMAQSPTFTLISGEFGPGALYEIAMPTAPWNGELVVFAQGIGNPSDPIALPAVGALRNTFTSQGFAFVYTSRSVNGYGAVKDGMQRTHQLRGIFVDTIGQPTRVYLMGRSLGGLISVGLAESYPSQYDGVLSGCGLLGGGAVELKYLADARILFEYFFPGIIPFGPFDLPDDPVFAPGHAIYDAVLKALMDGFVSPGQPTLQFARTANLQAVGPSEIVTAGLTTVGFTITQAHDLLEVTHGHMPFDNSETWYTGSDDDVALNAGVTRYFQDPSAANYMKHNYTPNGDLHIPVITLHRVRDPLAPLFHETIYAGRVADADASAFLLQRTVDGFAHCGFPADETAAFSALVQWVKTGVKPQN
jgi:pimeloyl-ACP methyl ester carboxylesterase